MHVAAVEVGSCIAGDNDGGLAGGSFRCSSLSLRQNGDGDQEEAADSAGEDSEDGECGEVLECEEAAARGEGRIENCSSHPLKDS